MGPEMKVKFFFLVLFLASLVVPLSEQDRNGDTLNKFSSGYIAVFKYLVKPAAHCRCKQMQSVWGKKTGNMSVDVCLRVLCHINFHEIWLQ